MVYFFVKKWRWPRGWKMAFELLLVYIQKHRNADWVENGYLLKWFIYILLTCNCEDKVVQQ